MARKKRADIPQTREEFTAEWFTEVLGEPVSEVVLESIGTDVGFMGEIYRCHLTPGDTGGGLPTSVVIKVPTANDRNFALGDALQAYEREISVYREMRASLGLPVPGYVYGAMDPDPAPWLERPVMFLFDKLPLRGINWVLSQFLKLSGKSKRRYVLVIEDIVDARPPEQFEGGSFDDARAALRVLAAFHAHNWMRSEAVESHRRIWPLNRASRVYQASYVRNRERFVERFGDAIGDHRMAHLDEIQQRVPEINDALTSPPWTLLHGDYRLDNLLFRPDGEIVVLDLQGIAYGRAAFDVAYFVTTALTADHKEDEQLLLRTYHDALVAAGVDDYPWDDFVADCRLTTEMLAHRIVGAADIIDTELVGRQGALIDVLQHRVIDWLD